MDIKSIILLLVGIFIIWCISVFIENAFFKHLHEQLDTTEEQERNGKGKDMTIEEVYSFIDETPVKELDRLELKSRIAELVKTERAKAVDELKKKLIINFSNWQMSLAEVGNEREYETIQQAIDGILEIAEQMKGGE